MQHERGGGRHVAGHERHALFHQGRDEGDVARQPIEFGNQQRGTGLPAVGDGLAKLGPVGVLAAFGLDQLGEQRPGAAVREPRHRLALGLDAEAATALLVGADAQIGNKSAVHGLRITPNYGRCSVVIQREHPCQPEISGGQTLPGDRVWNYSSGVFRKPKHTKMCVFAKLLKNWWHAGAACSEPRF